MNNVGFSDYLAISNTKARYCRCLDEKDWQGYGDVFTDDVLLDTRSAGGEKHVGREAAVASVRDAVGSAVTAHQVHSPEITLVNADTADVVWAMQDRVVWDEVRAREIGIKSLTGYGHYRERYARCEDGQWRITCSVLTRLHVDFESLLE